MLSKPDKYLIISWGGKLMKRVFGVLSVSFLALMPAVATAQDSFGDIADAQSADQSADEAGLNVIVVTAQRREQDIQDVPISVTAISGDELTKVGIGDFNSNTTGAVGVYVDDVFLGANAGKLFNVFDSDGIEVLKGPQGTLYGRNTTAGAIRFSSRKPTDELSADAAVSYGRFNEVQAGRSWAMC